MDFRTALKTIFGRGEKITAGTWKEIGGYNSQFSSFGADAYANEVVRACMMRSFRFTKMSIYQGFFSFYFLRSQIKRRIKIDFSNCTRFLRWYLWWFAIHIRQY